MEAGVAAGAADGSTSGPVEAGEGATDGVAPGSDFELEGASKVDPHAATTTAAPPASDARSSARRGRVWVVIERFWSGDTSGALYARRAAGSRKEPALRIVG